MSLTSVRVLIIEDRQSDADLVVSEFEDAGYTVHWQRVESADSLREALATPWELIISDHSMPSFNSRAALKIVKESGVDVPFLLVSGSIGEREAVDMMRLGINDYILKDNLDRLVVSAERELREAENRRKRRSAEKELRESEMRLRAAYQEAERLNQVKDEFLATLSHELRTPVNIIMGNADLLREKAESDGDEETRELADAIYRSAINQTQLINDLLDVSSIITGKIRFEPTEVSPVDVIQEVVTSLRPMAQGKRIELKTELSEAPARLTADKNRLHQVLWNLLSNALKFTSEGGLVEVRAYQKDLTFLIEVKDNGLGISREYLSEIFERFHQEDHSITRKFGGMGLGLSIVRHLVELHGGTVKAESEGRGLGSKFIVCMPIVLNGPGPQKAMAHEALSQDLKGVRILVIEDSSDNRALVSRILERVGAEVSDASSAEEARMVLNAMTPDLILSDIGMPNEDGMQFMKGLRSRSDALRSIPAVALTAYARPDEVQQTLASGFHAHVAKPVSAPMLILAIQDAIKTSKS